MRAPDALICEEQGRDVLVTSRPASAFGDGSAGPYNERGLGTPGLPAEGRRGTHHGRRTWRSSRQDPRPLTEAQVEGRVLLYERGWPRREMNPRRPH